MSTVVVRVEGLDELRRALRAAGRDLPRELKAILNEAGGLIATATRLRVPVRSGRLAASIRPRSTQREGRVQMGTPARVPYAGWIEFGGTIRHHGTRHQHAGSHRIHRKHVRNGRYLYPAGLDASPRVSDLAATRIEQLMRRTGLL